MHLADLPSYLEAARRLVQLYADRKGWVERALLKLASSPTFSSDCTIAQYAAETWDAEPYPVR